MAIFRNFCRCFVCALFACVFVFAIFDEAHGYNYILSLDNGSSNMYTNDPDTQLGLYYHGDGTTTLWALDHGYYGLLWVHPTTIVLDVPNSPSFMGYYSSNDSSAVQCINAYGELTSAGQNVANQWSTGNHTWYARYAPAFAIRLDQSGVTKGHHGKEFLFYDTSNHKLYQDYNASTGFSNELTVSGTSSGSVITNLPNRDGYNLAGFWSTPSGTGTKYINTTGNVGRVTQDGLNAVNGYNGSSLITWYARWEEIPHDLIYYCGPTIDNENYIAYDSSNTLAKYQNLQSSVVGPITVGESPYGDQIICNPPASDYDFMGWACGGFNGGFYSWADASFYGTGDSSGVGLTTDFQLMQEGTTFDLVHDTKCLAIWRQRLSCGTDEPIDLVLGQTNSSVVLSENPVNSSTNPMSFSYGQVFVEGMCAKNVGLLSFVPGTPVPYSYDPNNPTPLGHCWCRVSGYTPTGGNYTSLEGITSWLYDGSSCLGDDEDADDNCAMGCIKSLSGSEEARSVFYSSQSCSYDVVYNCNGTSNTISVFAGITVDTSGESCTAPGGYNFTGWSCSYIDSNNTQQTLPDGTFTMPSYNVTCNADFSPKSYTITYNCANGVAGQESLPDTGSSHTPNTDYWYGEDVTLWSGNQNQCTAPENKVFVGWGCIYDNEDGWAPPGEFSDDSHTLYTTVHLVNINDDADGTVCYDAICDIPCDNVICTARWWCAEGYHWDNLLQNCTNGYRIMYMPGQHGEFATGYSSAVFGPGVESGGATYGQPWTTKTLAETHIGAQDACYEFCGWSEYSNTTCESSLYTIYAPGESQSDWPSTLNTWTTLNLYAIWQCADGCVQSGNQCVTAPTTYTLTYNVTAPAGAGISTPAADNSVTGGTENYPLANVPTATGYTCSSWSCVDSNSDVMTVNSDNQITLMPSYNVTCSTTCSSNIVGLQWLPNGGTLGTNSMPGSCVYNTDDGISGISPNPTKTGYTFNGWLISGWDSVCGANVLQGSQGSDFFAVDWHPLATYGNKSCRNWTYSTTYCGDSVFSDLNLYEFKVVFDYGTVYGLSKCSDNQSASGVTAPSDTSGQYCWCSVNGYTPAFGSQCNLSAELWAESASHDLYNESNCLQSCAFNCARDVMINNGGVMYKLYGITQ